MNYFQRRKLNKLKKHILHESRHARYMREDVIEAAEIDQLIALEKSVEDAWGTGNSDEMEQAFEAINEQIKVVYPAPAGSPKFRENVEIVAVALAVALGFRTYFVQPFKIPTGSMQPTLNGIRISDEQKGKKAFDNFPLWIPNYLLTGTRYIEVRAKASGVITVAAQADNYLIYRVGGSKSGHKILGEMPKYFDVGQYVDKGQILASGRVLSGDHILVNKIKYNFTRPKRGEIVVFNTKQIEHPQIKQDAFYIKRLVGLPGESIGLTAEGYLTSNNERVTAPSVFNWKFSDKYKNNRNIRAVENGDIVTYYEASSVGYARERRLPAAQGPYTLVSDIQAKLVSPSHPIRLDDDQYLFFGDNTLSSLDGRYFGGVQQRSVIGPAFAVYWPFKDRSKILTNK
jgi:signal peptidase I